MSGEAVKEKKKTRVAWGISGSGDKLAETVDVMINVKKEYANEVDIRVYLSKAGEQVIRWYKLDEKLNGSFDRVLVEANSNSPFLAGDLQGIGHGELPAVGGSTLDYFKHAWLL